MMLTENIFANWAGILNFHSNGICAIQKHTNWWSAKDDVISNVSWNVILCHFLMNGCFKLMCICLVANIDFASMSR